MYSREVEFTAEIAENAERTDSKLDVFLCALGGLRGEKLFYGFTNLDYTEKIKRRACLRG
jgi:hypothetical protein